MARSNTRSRQPINKNAARHEWMADAACKGLDTLMFFDLAAPDRALAICAQCPVRAECAEFATKTKGVGIWGGQVIRGYAGGVWFES